jgi:glycosyltransferase involved in cell wall biosynthesis
MAGMSDSPLASVVIPTAGRRRLVQRLLDALARQTVEPSRFEVIVVSDGAVDGTVELVEGYPAPFSLSCLSRPHQGRAAACNAGIDVTRGSLLAILDDDMEPVPGWLEAHLAAHGSSERTCVIGAVPVTAEADASPLEAWIRRNFDEHEKKLSEPGHRFTLADFYSGNASLRRRLLEEVGGFDEDFSVLYGNEDVELYARLRRVGVELIFSTAAAAAQDYHKTFPAYARDTREAGRTAVLFARKHPDLSVELVHFRVGRGVWRRASGLLLWTARRSELVPKLVVRLEALLSRLVPQHLTSFYGHAANFFFWLGVSDEQRDGDVVLRR